MKLFVTSSLIAVSLLLSAGYGAAEVNTIPVAGNSIVKAAGEGSKSDVKTSATAGKEAVKGAVANTAASVKAKIVDINTATVAELKAIPGIGEAYAAKIIAGRPYANKAQLKSRNILPNAIYEQVKDLIIAKLLKK